MGILKHNPIRSTLAAALLVLGVSLPLRAEDAPPLVPSSSRHFEFHSGFWVNLHHFLYVQARARLRTRDSRSDPVAGAPAELRALNRLPAEQRRDFESALDHYRRTVASRDLLFDEELRWRTAAIALQESSAVFDAAIGDDLADALRRAAPAYRAAWWTSHDQANRRWVASMDALLAEHEAGLAEWIAKVWSTAWPDKPLRVDVCAYASWSGAYTAVRPSRITVASRNPRSTGLMSLEILFHEAMHAIGSRIGPMLRREASARSMKVPKDLFHAMMFYTAGDAVRRRVPSHVPYADKYAVWRRMKFGKLLDRQWKPYLDGAYPLPDAIARVLNPSRADSESPRSAAAARSRGRR